MPPDLSINRSASRRRPMSALVWSSRLRVCATARPRCVVRPRGFRPAGIMMCPSLIWRRPERGATGRRPRSKAAPGPGIRRIRIYGFTGRTPPFRYHAVPHRFPSMVVARARKYPVTCCCCVAVPNDTPGAIAVTCSTDESGRAWARIRFPRPRTRDACDAPQLHVHRLAALAVPDHHGPSLGAGFPSVPPTFQELQVTESFQRGRPGPGKPLTAQRELCVPTRLSPKAAHVAWVSRSSRGVDYSCG
jgi:hypothetical protein